MPDLVLYRSARAAVSPFFSLFVVETFMGARGLANRGQGRQRSLALGGIHFARLLECFQLIEKFPL